VLIFLLLLGAAPPIQLYAEQETHSERGEILFGDSGNRGTVWSSDATRIARFAVGHDVGFIDIRASDVNLDGVVDLADVTALMRALVGYTNTRGPQPGSLTIVPYCGESGLPMYEAVIILYINFERTVHRTQTGVISIRDVPEGSRIQFDVLSEQAVYSSPVIYPFTFENDGYQVVTLMNSATMTQNLNIVLDDTHYTLPITVLRLPNTSALFETSYNPQHLTVDNLTEVINLPGGGTIQVIGHDNTQGRIVMSYDGNRNSVFTGIIQTIDFRVIVNNINTTSIGVRTIGHPLMLNPNPTLSDIIEWLKIHDFNEDFTTDESIAIRSAIPATDLGLSDADVININHRLNGVFLGFDFDSGDTNLTSAQKEAIGSFYETGGFTPSPAELDFRDNLDNVVRNNLTAVMATAGLNLDGTSAIQSTNFRGITLEGATEWFNALDVDELTITERVALRLAILENPSLGYGINHRLNGIFLNFNFDEISENLEFSHITAMTNFDETGGFTPNSAEIVTRQSLQGLDRIYLRKIMTTAGLNSDGTPILTYDEIIKWLYAIGSCVYLTDYERTDLITAILAANLGLNENNGVNLDHRLMRVFLRFVFVDDVNNLTGGHMTAIRNFYNTGGFNPSTEQAIARSGMGGAARNNLAAIMATAGLELDGSPITLANVTDITLTGVLEWFEFEIHPYKNLAASRNPLICAILSTDLGFLGATLNNRLYGIFSKFDFAVDANNFDNEHQINAISNFNATGGFTPNEGEIYARNNLQGADRTYLELIMASAGLNLDGTPIV
jgi:hypothetical protein